MNIIEDIELIIYNGYYEILSKMDKYEFNQHMDYNKHLISEVLNFFTSREEYEICNELIKIRKIHE